MDDDLKYKLIMTDMINKQSGFWLAIALFIGLVPTAMIFSFLAVGTIPALMLLIPGLFLGLLIRLFVDIYDFWLRFLTGATLVGLLFYIFYLGEAGLLAYVIALINGIMVIVFSKKGLSKDQEKALWLYRQGLLKVKS